jgi:hypothetical protein
VKRRWFAAVALIALALPPAAVLHLIASRAVNVPYSDEWSLVLFVLKAHAGTVSWSDLWAQHNEHRIVSLRLISLLLLPFTGFNLVTYMLIAFAMATTSLMLMWRALRWTFPAAPGELPLALSIVVSLFVFSLVQWETWIHSMPALQGQLTTLCAAVTVWALSRWPQRPLALVVSGLATVLSMTALASGLLLWCAVIVTQVLHRWARREVVRGVALSGSGVLLVMVAAYFSAYTRPSWHPDPLASLQTPFALLPFIAAYLAMPVAYGRSGSLAADIGVVASAVSAVLLILTVIDSRRAPGRSADAVPWMTLWLYSVGVAIVTAAGRAGLGLGAAFAPRYAAAASLFWVASAVIGALWWRRHREALPRPWRIAATVGAGACCALVMAEYGRAYRTGRQIAIDYSARLVVAETNLKQLESAPPSVFEFLYPPSPSIARRYSGLLRYAGLGPFAGTARLEPVNSDRRELAGYQDTIECEFMTGWAIDYFSPGQSISVDVYDGDRLVTSALAAEFRLDLRDAGIGTGRYGFSLKDGQPHQVVLRAAGAAETLSERSVELRCDSARRP